MPCTSVHYKPTDSHSYLLYSIPYSQFLRLRRLCSDDSDFPSKSEEMCQFFEKRGYPFSVVIVPNNLINSQHYKCHKKKDKNDRISFTLTFHPHNHAGQSIILNNLILRLVESFPTSTYFIQTQKNIGNFLVRSALKTNEQLGTLNARAHNAKLVLSFLTLARYWDLRDLLRSLIVSHVPPQMSFIA